MLRIRHFEMAIERLFAEGRIGGTAHPAIGQEACAVGMGAARRHADPVTSTHRGHGHFLALGADPGRMMAEFFGKADGYCSGRAGSQMMADPSIGFLGANGITAGSLAMAAGVALSFRYREEPHAVIAIFGDGASSQGVFHETLNMAALWKLPLVLFCENNGYGMSMPTESGVAGSGVLERARAFGIKGETVDGNDVVAVYAATRRALEHASAEGPILLELMTYRLSGHSKGDPRIYRSRDEEAAAWRRDPITRLEETLALPEQDREAAREAAEAEIAAAIQFAENSPLPDNATAAQGVCDDA
jgi:TPP-dependent pyruvate/acetoin dehydrogenase alpha subunit